MKLWNFKLSGKSCHPNRHFCEIVFFVPKWLSYQFHELSSYTSFYKLNLCKNCYILSLIKGWKDSSSVCQGLRKMAILHFFYFLYRPFFARSRIEIRYNSKFAGFASSNTEEFYRALHSFRVHYNVWLYCLYTFFKLKDENNTELIKEHQSL